MDDGRSDHLETELKFEAGPDFVIPDLSGLAAGLTVGEPEVSLLVANYYDTSDLRLAAARITLRRRTGGDDEGWHLKLPADQNKNETSALHIRRELHEPLGQGDAVPSRFQAAVSAWTKGQPLGVIAVLETSRTVRRLVAAGGELAAELADDQVTGRVPIKGDAASEAVTWREIEVELASADPGILTAAASALESAGARRSDSASKLSRLLGSPTGRAARQQHPAG
jgi:inorganic triphosphatase YgiF